MLQIKTATAVERRRAAAYGALSVAAVALLATRLPSAHLSLIAAASPAVKIHIFAALSALLIGTVQMIGRKGGRLHRILGWTWVILMGTVAFGSFFIRGINPHGFSLIHLLSGWTLAVLPLGVVFARRGQIRRHRRTMAGVYIGGLIIAGAFTFAPGRLMWQVFFG